MTTETAKIEIFRRGELIGHFGTHLTAGECVKNIEEGGLAAFADWSGEFYPSDVTQWVFDINEMEWLMEGEPFFRIADMVGSISEVRDEDEDTITVTASDDGSSEETTCERGDDYEALARGLFEDADYGHGDYRVTIRWEATDADGDEIDGGTYEMTGETEEPPCPAADEHDWTSEGEGGCDSNPGVWSTGGTGMNFHSHCRACGLKRVEHHTGIQRNPGECDTTTYGDSDD